MPLVFWQAFNCLRATLAGSPSPAPCVSKKESRAGSSDSFNGIKSRRDCFLPDVNINRRDTAHGELTEHNFAQIVSDRCSGVQTFWTRQFLEFAYQFANNTPALIFGPVDTYEIAILSILQSDDW